MAQDETYENSGPRSRLDRQGRGVSVEGWGQKRRATAVIHIADLVDIMQVNISIPYLLEYENDLSRRVSSREPTR
jgi:hypothetical protein